MINPLSFWLLVTSHLSLCVAVILLFLRGNNLNTRVNELEEQVEELEAVCDPDPELDEETSTGSIFHQPIVDEAAEFTEWEKLRGNVFPETNS